MNWMPLALKVLEYVLKYMLERAEDNAQAPCAKKPLTKQELKDRINYIVNR